MYILIGDTKIEWKEEKTRDLQIESLCNFAFALGYEKNNEKISQGFKVNSGFGSYYNKTNYISFEAMCRLHNYVTRDMYVKPDLKYINTYSLSEKLSVDSALFMKRDRFLEKLILNCYPLKLVEEVKLQKNSKVVDGVDVISNLVRVTELGDTYLEQNYFIFRKNQILVE